MNEVTRIPRYGFVSGTTTDEQFIRAMRRVVKEQGENRIASGAYWSANGAYCIVGAALYSIDSALCPRNNQMLAEELLLHVGCSPKVAMAAHVAQFANDAGMPWGDVLAVFRWGLENWRPNVDKEQFTHEAVYRHPDRKYGSVMPMVVKSGHIANHVQYISEEAIVPVMTWASTGTTLGTSTPVLIKKEHALAS